ncbi:hypothetical protein CFC21_015462, partial [Triticum aestivum]
CQPKTLYASLGPGARNKRVTSLRRQTSRARVVHRLFSKRKKEKEK